MSGQDLWDTEARKIWNGRHEGGFPKKIEKVIKQNNVLPGKVCQNVDVKEVLRRLNEQGICYEVNEGKYYYYLNEASLGSKEFSQNEPKQGVQVLSVCGEGNENPELKMAPARYKGFKVKRQGEIWKIMAQGRGLNMSWQYLENFIGNEWSAELNSFRDEIEALQLAEKFAQESHGYFYNVDKERLEQLRSQSR